MPQNKEHTHKKREREKYNLLQKAEMKTMMSLILIYIHAILPKMPLIIPFPISNSNSSGPGIELWCDTSMRKV